MGVLEPNGEYKVKCRGQTDRQRAMFDYPQAICYPDRQDCEGALWINGGSGEPFEINITETRGNWNGLKKIQVASEFACALFDDGSVWCWGACQHWSTCPLGTAWPFKVWYKPHRVWALGQDEFVTDLVLGAAHVCVLLDNKQVKCWGGHYPFYVGYPDGTDGSVYKSTAATITDTDGNAILVEKIDAAAYATCAITVDGLVKCWGRNADCECGQITESDRYAKGAYFGFSCEREITHFVQAVTVKNRKADVDLDATGALDIAGFGDNSGSFCIILADHTLKCWGNGYAWALGHAGYWGNTWNMVTTMTDAEDGRGNRINWCELDKNRVTSDKRCEGWEGEDTGTPVQAAKLALGSQENFMHVIKPDGSVVSWGQNQYGQQGGNLAKSNQYEPVAVPLPTELVDNIDTIFSSNFETLIITKTGQIWGTGLNMANTLGSDNFCLRESGNYAGTHQCNDYMHSKSQFAEITRHWVNADLAPSAMVGAPRMLNEVPGPRESHVVEVDVRHEISAVVIVALATAGAGLLMCLSMRRRFIKKDAGTHRGRGLVDVPVQSEGTVDV